MKNIVPKTLLLSLAVSSLAYGWGCWNQSPEVPEIVDEATKVKLAQELFDKMYHHEDIPSSSIKSCVKKGVDMKNWRDESGLSLADAELVYDKGSRGMQPAGSVLTEKGLASIVNSMFVASASGNLSDSDRARYQRLIQEYKKAGISLTVDKSQMAQVEQIQSLANMHCDNFKDTCYFGTDMPNACNTKKDWKYIMAHAIKSSATVAAVEVKK